MRQVRARLPLAIGENAQSIAPPVPRAHSIIAALVKRKWTRGTSEAEMAMIDRVLNGLRYKYEEAGPSGRASTYPGALLPLTIPSCRPAADSRPATEAASWRQFLNDHHILVEGVSAGVIALQGRRTGRNDLKRRGVRVSSVCRGRT
jgi:hypothetical protein